jgi:CheY-like chemotaxis protein
MERNQNPEMKPKVLVVDDEPETLSLLDYVLCGEGFDVTTAGNGIEALTKAPKVRPDVVLLDIKLPEMDGFAVCELLRAQSAPADLPVILFSNYGGISLQARGLEAGSRQCLRKSEGFEAVVRSLRQAVEEKTPSGAKGGKRTGNR